MKVCPEIRHRQDPLPLANKVFCCSQEQVEPIYSQSMYDTMTNVNKHLHYEYMCTKNGRAAHLCDPKTGKIVSFDGTPTPFKESRQGIVKDTYSGNKVITDNTAERPPRAKN